MDLLRSPSHQRRVPPVSRHHVPPPTGRHVCRHPVLHGVVVWTGTLAWVGVALWWGLPLWLRLSRLVPPVLGLLALVGLGLVWISWIVPAGAAIVHTVLHNNCQRLPPPPLAPRVPPPPPSRRIRRVILSPEAAWQRLGIRGEVILEEEEEEP